MIKPNTTSLSEKLEFKMGLFSLSIVFMLLSSYGYSQTVIRQSISSYGTTTTGDDHYYAQTIGQSFNTQSVENSRVMQGFLQPVSIKIEKVAQEDVEELDIKIFPNPSRYSVTLKSSDALNEAVILISNVQGHIIYNQKILNLEEHVINCSTWATGLYLLKIQDDRNKQSVSKLIISK
ncbi:T9SS type A sorting domain-containing protein [Aestuariivivens sediminicola]|uniref:T9SS type A sorting domain-containing protein n=1 Tax=Aestuariivivens sediminicola TaxID=2913560 RepID=UPI001F59553D|nr:T9SS type A sorting domain-containing protein [Aestuariivivens sediminicola]